MLAKFRHRYPQGSLVGELVKIDRGTYIVKAVVGIEDRILASAFASGDTVEAAEDAAKERAIATLFLDSLAPDETATKISLEPEPAAVKAAPRNMEDEATPSERSKIVNFSKPQSEAIEVAEPIVPIVEPTLPLAEVIPPSAEPKNEPQIEPQVEPRIERESEIASPSKMSEVAPESNLFGNIATEVADATLPEVSSHNNSATATVELEAMDFNDIKQKTDIEIRRLGWSKDQGKEFLMSHYGKRSRLHLTDEQLLEFLRYLEKLPNPG